MAEGRSSEDRIYWCGNPVDEMSRDEAITALKQCIRIYTKSQEQTLETWRKMAEIRQARKERER